MKRLVLILMLIPAAVVAQEKGLSPVASQFATATSAPDSVASNLGYNEGIGLSSNLNADASPVALDPSSASSSSQAGKAAPAAPPERPARPPIDGSMVGYIDNPIVESEVRIRLDDAIDDAFPDRAEFLYGKCGCYRGLQTAIPVAYDPNAPGPGLGVPKSVNYRQLYMNAEYSPQRRFSAFVEVPVRWLVPQGFLSAPPFPGFSSQSGLSDVTAGLKFAAVATEGTYVTFQLKSYFPTGDASGGLGTNHYSVEPSALVYHRFTEKWTMEGQIGDWHPIGGSAGVPTAGSQGFAGDVFFYGIGPSYKLYRGRNFGLTPVIELFGWHVLSGFQTQVGGPVDGASANVSGFNVVNIKAGIRTNVGLHDSVYVGFGQAVTHEDWYRQIVRFEYRHAF